MNRWKKLLVALVIIPLVAFIGLEVRSLLTHQRVEAQRRELVAIGGRTKTDKRVPAWLGMIAGDDFHTFLDETILSELTLKGPEVNDASLERIRGLEDLRILDLSESDITDEGLRNLSGLTNLRMLNLFKTNVSDLTPLQSLSSLETLILEHTKIDDEDLDVLEHFPHLRELNLGYLDLTDVGLRKIAPCRDLETLGLSGIDLTREDFEFLNEFPKLRTVVSRNSHVDPEGAELFKKGLDNRNVIVN